MECANSHRFHDKVQRFVDREHHALPQDQIGAQLLFGQPQSRASPRGAPNGLSVRGPSNTVDDLTAKIRAFLQQEEEDEAERGHITTFDYPQKYANFLIGKKGENINKLREEYDVDIQVNDGKVILKGPQAKADAAKTAILALARKLEDEATYVLRIEPEYHRDLIGAKGGQVNRLQDRYNVRINFPRSAALANDDADTDAGSAKNHRNQAPQEVIIKGPKRGADEARDELLSLLQYMKENSFTATVSIARDQIPKLIGQGGREMDGLRATTGAQIDIPNREDNTSGRVDVKLKGSKKQVEDAKRLLQERAKQFDDTTVRTIDIEKKHHRALIGTGGMSYVDCSDMSQSILTKYSQDRTFAALSLKPVDPMIAGRFNALPSSRGPTQKIPLSVSKEVKPLLTRSTQPWRILLSNVTTKLSRPSR